MDVQHVFEMDWDIQVEGRAWRGSEAHDRYDRAPEKLELIEGRLCWTDEERLTLLALLLENVGLNQAVRLAPAERWRVALRNLQREASR